MVVTVTLNPSLDEWVELPRLHLGGLNRALAFSRYPGGKGINVSRVIHELRGQTLAVALAGGSDGHILGELLRDHGIAHRFVTVLGSTRNNSQIHTASPKALTQINCPGPRASAAALRVVERFLDRLRPPKACVVCSGSLPPGASTSIYARWIRRASRRGVPSVLDASGPALREGLRARPWLIKPNREEAEELLGVRLRRRADVVRAARRLTLEGASVALLSLGADGAVLVSRAPEAVLWADAPRVRVDSAVGAGDSLVAGFVVGWMRTRSLGQAFRLGMACATACVMTPGTELCRRADVMRLLPRIRLKAR